MERSKEIQMRYLKFSTESDVSVSLIDPKQLEEGNLKFKCCDYDISAKKESSNSIQHPNKQ